MLLSLHGVRVGALRLDPGGRSTFRFDEAYLTHPERPVLGRWYEERLLPEFVEKSTHTTLPPFFQNYLPEEGSLLRELLARRAGVAPWREFDLLLALGEDLPGALVVNAEQADVDVGGQYAAGATILQTVHDDEALRFSLAGMQLKFSVLRIDERLTIPVRGKGGRFILKLPSPGFPRVPEIEHACLLWARAVGLTVPDVELVKWRDVDGLPDEIVLGEDLGLLVRRFDRTNDGERIHQEDFAQVLGRRPQEKYGDDALSNRGATYGALGKVIARACGETDFEEYLRRLVFVVMTGNADAHLKNWSLTYPDRRRPRLAPAYDLVPTCVFPGIRTRLALSLAREDDPQRITPAHFGRLAVRAGFTDEFGREIAADTATRIRGTWGGIAARMPSPARDVVVEHFNRVPL
jgi:serine/threonine-protein kinase HipA